MKYIGQIKSRLEILLIFLVIFVSGGFINLDVQVLVSASALIAMLLAILVVLRGSIINKAASRAMMVFVFAMSIFLVKILFAEAGFKYTPFLFRIIGNVLLAILILMYFYSDRRRLFECVYFSLVLVLFQSLLSMVLWPVVQNSLTFSGVEYINTFNYLVFYHADVGLASAQLFGQPLPRNAGIFWEPGILQMYLNMLLFVVLYIRKNSIIALLTVVAILSTWSTTGVVILGAQLIIYSLVNIKKPIYAILSLVMLFALVGQIVVNVHEKLEGEQAGSGYSRALDTFTAINVISKHPILGVDLDYEVFEDSLFQNIANVKMEGRFESRDARATNSVLNYFVFFGIPFGVFIVLGLYNQRLFPTKRVVLFLIMMLSLSTEPVGFFLFPMLLLLSGFVYGKKRVAAVSP